MTCRIVCGVCPHHCVLEEGQTGFCRARANHGGLSVSLTYGMLSSLALDPIEKKPLRRFYPGSMILSAGTTGCNLRCAFCQNHEISMAATPDIPRIRIEPENLVAEAMKLKPQGNIGLAFTYNEPLIGFEYVLDSARLARNVGLKTVLVTNGYTSPETLYAVLPFIDAMNIDLKGFTGPFYSNLKGDLETVKNTIHRAHSVCHVEVTTLIIPNENDSPEDMEHQAAWLASLNRDIPLHITRFFPRHQYYDRDPTPPETLAELGAIAEQHLRYVYYPGRK